MGNSTDRPLAPEPAIQIALASAKGSPGVTSLALTLGLVWPGSVIVGELDPAGGDLASRLPLPKTDGLAALAAAARHEVNGDQLAESLLSLTTTCSLLVAPADPTVSSDAVGVLAEVLPVAARSAGVAGVWDLGRLDPASPAWAALAGCDLAAVISRPAAGELAHAVPLIRQVADAGCPVGLILASPRRGRAGVRESDLADAVAERVGQAVPLLGRVVFDPLGVSLAERLMVHWAGRCALGNSVRRLSEQLVATEERNSGDRDQQTPPPWERTDNQFRIQQLVAAASAEERPPMGSQK